MMIIKILLSQKMLACNRKRLAELKLNVLWKLKNKKLFILFSEAIVKAVRLPHLICDGTLLNAS